MIGAFCESSVVVPRILIIGRQRAGKTTLANLVARHHPSWRSVAVSDVIIDYFADRLGVSPAKLRAEKDRYRAVLIALADPISAEDPTTFVRMALSRANIINGVRRAREFVAVREWFNVTVFVTCPSHEAIDGDNYDIPESLECECDVTVINSVGDLENMQEAAAAIADQASASLCR